MLPSPVRQSRAGLQCGRLLDQSPHPRHREMRVSTGPDDLRFLLGAEGHVARNEYDRRVARREAPFRARVRGSLRCRAGGRGIDELPRGGNYDAERPPLRPVRDRLVSRYLDSSSTGRPLRASAAAGSFIDQPAAVSLGRRVGSPVLGILFCAAVVFVNVRLSSSADWSLSTSTSAPVGAVYSR